MIYIFIQVDSFYQYVCCLKPTIFAIYPPVLAVERQENQIQI